MRRLITVAFKEIVNDEYLKGGPNWLDSDRFDLVAKPPPNASGDAARLMVQAVLVERFHLVVHREAKPMAVYALVQEPKGAKISASANSEEGSCTGGPSLQIRSIRCDGVTMLHFTSPLTFYMDAPVVDRTGMTGLYDVQVDWDGNTKLDTPPALIRSVAKLGLKLERRKEPMPIIVIDSIDRVPSAN